jgi:hypothetical protein
MRRTTTTQCQRFSCPFKPEVGLEAVVGNFIVEYFIAFLGIKYTFVVAAVVYATACLVFTFTESIAVLFLAAFMIGFHDQCTMMNAIKSIKSYTVEPFATKYVSWAMTGYATGPFLWPFLLSWIINPLNLRKTHIYAENGTDVAYFSESIVANFVTFMKIQLVAYLVVIGTLIYQFESPPGFNGMIWKYIRHTMKGETGDAHATFKHSMRMVRQDFNAVVGHTIDHHSGIFIKPAHPHNSASRKLSIKEDKALIQRISMLKSENKNFKNSIVLQNRNKSFQKQSFTTFGVAQELTVVPENPSLRLDNPSKIRLDLEGDGLPRKLSAPDLQKDPKSQALLEEEHSDLSFDENEFEEAVIKEEIRRDMLSLNFWIIVAMGIVRTSTSRYYLSYFKLLGLYYFDDDAVINTIGSLSYIFYIVQGFTYPRTLELLGIRNCYLVTFLGFASIHVIYSINPYSLPLYIMLTFAHRVT